MDSKKVESFLGSELYHAEIQNNSKQFENIDQQNLAFHYRFLSKRSIIK